MAVRLARTQALITRSLLPENNPLDKEHKLNVH